MDSYDGIPAIVNYLQTVRSSQLDLQAPPRDGLVWQYSRYLLQKAISTFTWEMPKPWSRSYFLYVLYCFGRLAIINTDKFGVIPQACGLMGYNVFYQPTNAIITNTLLTGIREPKIDVDCVVLKLQPDYGGIMDLVNTYANLLAECVLAAGINVANSKTAVGFYTDKKNVAEAVKKAYDAVVNGQPLVVTDKSLLNPTDGKPVLETFFRDVKASYILSDLLSDMRKIEAMFDTDIGIPNANTDKRERLITDEVNANNTETYSKCALWLESLQLECAKARDMFGIDLSVDWRVPPEEKMNEEVPEDA